MKINFFLQKILKDGHLEGKAYGESKKLGSFSKKVSILTYRLPIIQLLRFNFSYPCNIYVFARLHVHVDLNVGKPTLAESGDLLGPKTAHGWRAVLLKRKNKSVLQQNVLIRGENNMEEGNVH